MRVGGYLPVEWEWIRQARPVKMPRNVWGWPPGTYDAVMREASDNDAARQPSQPAAEHTCHLDADCYDRLRDAISEASYEETDTDRESEDMERWRWENGFSEHTEDVP